jgi:regulator of RNase E activity RraA
MSQETHPLARFSAATISDGLDRLGRAGSLLGISPLAADMRLCGRAYTVRYVTSGHTPGTVGDYLDDVPAGGVVVLDNAGRVDCTVWGDILTTMASHRGVAGTVIDGVCRDVATALSVKYPVYSRGRFMRTGKDRVEVSDVGRPVTVGGVQVASGQLIVGDADGVVAVPPDVEDRLVVICEEIRERESAIVDDVLAGRSLAAARAANHYHELQRAGTS